MFKKLKGLYIFIIIVLIIGVFYIYQYNSKPYSSISYDEIEHILDKSNRYNNYRMKYKYIGNGADGNESESPWMYYKDGYFKMENRGTPPNGIELFSILWQDTKTNKMINVSKSATGGGEDPIKQEFNITYLPIDRTRMFTQQVLNAGTNTTQYKYIGDELYNGEECYVIEVKTYMESYNPANEEQYSNMNYNKYYISKDTGFILYSLSEYYQNNKLTSSTAKEFTIEFDVVTDEDVTEPKSEDYPDFKLIETRSDY